MAKESWRPGNMLYPVPAVMVSCQRPGEKPNIITIAWAGTVCSSPAMVSISVRKERYSYDILKETGEFVINLVTKDLCGQQILRGPFRPGHRQISGNASDGTAVTDHTVPWYWGESSEY